MIVDTQNELSDAQAILNTGISTNVLDLFASVAGGATGSASAIIQGVSPNARIDVGQGEDIHLVVNTVTAVTGGATPTLTVTLESADDAALTVNPTVHFSSGALATAAFSAAGSQLVAVKLPAALYRRYLGVRYTYTGGPVTTAAYDAILVKDLQRNVIYKSAFTVQ